jgi:hypothetical protein
MSTETTIARLRRANPVPEAPAGDGAALFERITSSTPDPRLARGRRERPTRHRRRVVVVGVAIALAALLASTAFAISQWFGGSVVRPPVTRHEYRNAQHQLTLPPGVAWPKFNMPGPKTVTSRGGGGGRAVLIAENAWECYWVEAIRKGDTKAERQAQGELNALLANNVFVAPVGAPEGWIPSPQPTVPFAVWAHDGGLNWIRATYAAAAAGNPSKLIQSCRANAPG